MNTAPEGNPSEAVDYHAKQGAPGQRPRHTNTHRHPTEKTSPSPKSTIIRVVYNQQYKIVHNDSSDLHQHSVNSE